MSCITLKRRFIKHLTANRRAKERRKAGSKAGSAGLGRKKAHPYSTIWSSIARGKHCENVAKRKQRKEKNVLNNELRRHFIGNVVLLGGKATDQQNDERIRWINTGEFDQNVRVELKILPLFFHHSTSSYIVRTISWTKIHMRLLLSKCSRLIPPPAAKLFACQMQQRWTKKDKKCWMSMVFNLNSFKNETYNSQKRPRGIPNGMLLQ